jgi:O-succinylbenzoate synthase
MARERPMSLERITLTHIRVPLHEPFRISNGVVEEKDAIIVAISSEGETGYGEASPMAGGFYSDDTPESTWSFLTDRLVPLLLEKKPDSVDAVNALFDSVGGNAFARAGLETAFWDLEGQKRGSPLFELLGGSDREVDSGLAVGIEPTVEKLLASIEHHLEEGYLRLKIKIQPGWDVEPLRRIRRLLPDIPLMVDANCAYGRDDIAHLQRLDEFGLMMIEQPLPKGDLEGHAALQRVIATPVCLDESATDPSTVERAITMGSCRIVNIKIQRVGGLRAGVRIHDICAGHGIPVWAGTMPELGIGGAQTLHLGTLKNFAYPTDVQSSLRWFVDDIVEPLIEVKKGKFLIPRGAGNAYRLRPNVVARYRVREAVFRLAGK